VRASENLVTVGESFSNFCDGWWQLVIDTQNWVAVGENLSKFHH
jgi:hypothetical protein